MKRNRNILIIVYLFLTVCLSLVGYIVYFNIAKADSVINNPYNRRQSILEKKIKRGDIVSSDNVVLATTKKDSSGKEVRLYPFSNMFAHIVGYNIKGGFGLENLASYYLLQSNDSIINQIYYDASGEKYPGDNMVTTISYKLQQAAYDAMGDNKGAVIVAEPDTGKILAMVSKPDFDPNTLASDWNNIVKDDNGDSMLFNRATCGLYPPGSTFKLVTMLEYMRQNRDYMNYFYNCEGKYTLGDNSISCLKNHVHGELDLVNSLAHSCNSSFINIGLGLDVKKYAHTAEKLLFNKDLPLDITYGKSSFVLNEQSDEWEIAQTAFGQGKTLISPMHLCMLGMAIANNGVLMKPMFMDRIESVSGKVIKRFDAEKYERLMSEEESAYITKAMKSVVDTTFSDVLGDSGYSVCAKSGTAQYGNEGYEHSLFISFSPVISPRIVVCVVLEGGPQREEHSSAVAKKIYDAYYDVSAGSTN